MKYFLKKVSKIMTEDFCTLKPSDTTGDALHIMREHGISVILIKLRKKAVRLVSSRHLLKAGVYPKTRLGSIAMPAPNIMFDDTILDAAKALVSFRIEAVPVRDPNGDLLGIVTRYDIMKYALEMGWLEPFNVKDAMSTSPITISPSDSAGKARRILLDNTTRHVLVVKNNKLVGMVGVEDVLEKIYSITVRRSTRGEFVGETGRILSHPVKFIMSRPVFTVDVEDKLPTVVKIMMKMGVFSVPVMERDSVVGIISKGDIVKKIAALAIMKTIPLSFKGLEKMPQRLLDLTDTGISRTLEKLIRTTGLFEGRVVIKWQNREGKRTLYIFEVSAKAAEGIVTASETGWEPVQAFISALRMLERQSEKAITKKRKAERKRKMQDLSPPI